MSEQLDCVVIGAGIAGLAVARRMAQSGREVVVLEAEAAQATHTSSRNSEVIHAGIYYSPGSLKARLCVEGRRKLYAYCKDRAIPHRPIGKLIVACDAAELAILGDYLARARANGVMDLSILSPAEVTDLEPSVRCTGALLSPSTGIIDSHAYAMALRSDLEAAGGVVVLRSRVVRVDIGSKGFRLMLEGSDGAVSCATVVNAAGLGAPELAAGITGFPRERIPRRFLAKGHYFVLQEASPFAHLVYPVASGAGLGVHVTIDTNGSVRFGPDVEWVGNIDYAFDDSRKPQFIAAIRRYYPGLRADRLASGYTGIRPKISGPGEPAADFMLQGPGDHGVPGLMNLFGIESPGLTASLAIADMTCRELTRCPREWGYADAGM